MNNISANPTRYLIIALLAICAVTYNTLFAALVAVGGPINNGHVVMAELAVVFTGLVIIGLHGVKENDRLIILLALSVVGSALLIYIGSNLTAVAMIRNFLIVITFTMLGYRFNRQVFHRAIFIISVIVSIVLAIEMVSVEAYVNIFAPAKYYEATRGIEIKDYNTLGLFGNALGIEGRFNFGFFKAHRTSSIFLEQVSFANFMTVLAIYTTVFWREIPHRHKMLFIGLITFGLISNNSRTASIMCVICITLYQLYKISPLIVVLIKRCCLILVFSVASLIAFDNEFIYTGDNFVGRLSLGMSYFYDLTLLDYLGFGSQKLELLWDSGFAYLIASSTIFTTLAFIYFIHCYLTGTEKSSLLFSTLLIIYISLNLVTSGNAIYSMKTAPLLWIIFGILKKESTSSHEQPSAELVPNLNHKSPVNINH